MHVCLFFLLASLFLCQVSAQSDNQVETEIEDYFNSETLKTFRRQWEYHRKSMEHAINTALKESVGSAGMNVYVRKLYDGLAAGYYHNDNQVRIIFEDMILGKRPRALYSEVQFSLASNVIKIQTTLSKMIVHSDYTLLRNKTDIIYDPKDQDPYKSSPFLFEQVQNSGKVAITAEDCVLSGFIITKLSGNSVNLGNHQFNLKNCRFTIEIYRPGDGSPPVVAKYNPYREDEKGLDLKQLLMEPLLEEDLVPKVQTALYSFVNTSAIFGYAVENFQENQETVFQTTAEYLTELVRNMNRITVENNNGVDTIKDYNVFWDDGYRVIEAVKLNNVTDSHMDTMQGVDLHLSEMVLAGLETLYSAHTGGPIKIFNTVMIAEEIRFSSLQVRGKIELKNRWSVNVPFSAEISDMALDLQLGLSQSENPGLKKLKVKWLRHMSLAVPTLPFEGAASMIRGYLLNAVPKLIQTHLKDIFSKVFDKPDKEQLLSYTFQKHLHDYASLTDLSSDDSFFTNIDDYETVRGRVNLIKDKKRFKTINNPYRSRSHRGSRKHVVDNNIIKK